MKYSDLSQKDNGLHKISDIATLFEEEDATVTDYTYVVSTLKSIKNQLDFVSNQILEDCVVTANLKDENGVQTEGLFRINILRTDHPNVQFPLVVIDKRKEGFAVKVYGYSKVSESELLMNTTIAAKAIREHLAELLIEHFWKGFAK